MKTKCNQINIDRSTEKGPIECFGICFAVFINENIIPQSKKRKIRTIIRSYHHFYLKKHDTRVRVFSDNWEILPNASGTARRGRVFHTPGTCQIAYKIIISGKLIYFFYWQLLIILFAVDIAKTIWNYTSLCFEKGKIHFWRGNFRRGRASWRGAVMAFIPDHNLDLKR